MQFRSRNALGKARSPMPGALDSVGHTGIDRSAFEAGIETRTGNDGKMHNLRLIVVSAIASFVLIGSHPASFAATSGSFEEEEVIEQDVFDDPPKFVEQPVRYDARVALVIGNGAYRHIGRLPNPPNDANDMASALRASQFTVIPIINGTRDQMIEKLAKFSQMAKKADVAVIFYSGHGMQDAGINYLVPIDARLRDETDLINLIRVQDFIGGLSNARNIRILILDACRDNEAITNIRTSAAKFRGAPASRGLARDQAEGLMIAYSAQPGRTAADGAGRNSPFTEALLKYLPTPKLEVRSLFVKVRRDVLNQTGRKQRPELSDSLDGEFSFH